MKNSNCHALTCLDFSHPGIPEASNLCLWTVLTLHVRGCKRSCFVGFDFNLMLRNLSVPADGAYTVHYPKHFVSCRAGSVFRRLQDADMENPMCLFEKSFRLCLTCKCLCMRVCGYNNSENSLQVMEEMHRSEQVCNTKLAIAKTPWQAETVSKSKSQVLRSSLTETQKRCQVPFKLHMHSEVTDFSDLEFGSIIFPVVFRSFFVFCPIIFTCHHMWSCVIPLAASNT